MPGPLLGNDTDAICGIRCGAAPDIETAADMVKDVKSMKELRKYRRRELYAFSDAANLSEVMALFEERYWLNADAELISSRLRKRAKGRLGKIHGKTYGASKAQRDYVLRKLKSNNEWEKKMGFKFVDAALTPKAIFKIITS